MLAESMLPMIDDWRVLLQNGRVEGKGVNHPEIEDGAVILTSPLTIPGGIVALDKDRTVVETHSG
jgi:hypothetical protein